MSGYFSPDDRRPPITPALAVRVATLGFIALALFAIIFFRLWFLQVLAGDSYLSQASQNGVRDVAVAAPRGDIVDRNGNQIVTSRLANVVQLDPRSLPDEERALASDWGRTAGLMAVRHEREQRLLKARRDALKSRRDKAAKRELAKLPKPRADAPLPKIPPPPAALRTRFVSVGKVLGLKPKTVQRRVIQALAVLPYVPITLRVDVSRTIVQSLQERKASYPGLRPDTIFVRKYPEKTLAAQLLGNVGPIAKDQLKQAHFRDVAAGTIVGQAGVEYTYDEYLRGTNGVRKLQVDSLGNYIDDLSSSSHAPRSGHSLQLTLDLGLERAGEQALKTAAGLAHRNGHAAPGGAYVAMSPGTGAIYAMGSHPSFDPSIFTRQRISTAAYNALVSPSKGQPLLDRAVDGSYPTGSTFKPITALAAVQSGKITPSFSLNDGGCTQVGDAERCNAKKEPNGYVDLRSAMKVSSDVYFYTLGLKTNSARTEIIQSMAHKLGLGRPTGIDVPTSLASKGLIPDWKWRQRQNKKEKACRRSKHIPLGFDYSVYAAAAQGCGIADMREWSEGDNANLAVGQGDVQASPLQMAVAYSAIVENGRVPTPHLGMAVADSQGNTLQRLPTSAARTVKLDPAARQAVMDGLHLAASAPGGTSTPVWAGWDQGRYPVYGKTGTAETSSGTDQSWYVCWIKDMNNPKDSGIVIAVTIEKGGFGAEAAAPAARLIASKYFHVKSEVVEGNSQTR